jgi:hypothetical protein
MIMVFNATFNNITVISWRSVWWGKQKKPLTCRNHWPVVGWNYDFVVWCNCCWCCVFNLFVWFSICQNYYFNTQSLLLIFDKKKHKKLVHISLYINNNCIKLQNHNFKPRIIRFSKFKVFFYLVFVTSFCLFWSWRFKLTLFESMSVHISKSTENRLCCWDYRGRLKSFR